MTTPDNRTTAASMTFIEDVPSQIHVQANSTVSSTALKADGVRVVLFAFDTDEELSEHTAAVPALLQVLSGRLEITADGRTVELVPGGMIHLPTRMPHAVLAKEPSTLQLLLLDNRGHRAS